MNRIGYDVFYKLLIIIYYNVCVYKFFYRVFAFFTQFKVRYYYVGNGMSREFSTGRWRVSSQFVYRRIEILVPGTTDC